MNISKGKAKKTLFVGLFYRKALLPALIISLISIPSTTHAGIFSFVSGLLGGDRTESLIIENVANSQNIGLLKAAVNTDPNPAKGGGDITVIGGTALLPESGPSGTLADIEELAASAGQINVYVVRPGDSLSQIAGMFNVSINTIVWANDIRGSVIQEGQTLVILPITGIKHTVSKGETLNSLVKKYGADLEEVLAYNDLSEKVVLAVGDVVIIPDGVISTPKSSPSIKAPVKGSNAPSYAGYYIRPVSGGVRTQGLHGYNGVDLASSIGTPIVASASGNVLISKSSGWNGGYGRYIVIAHENGTQTLYAHLSGNIVFSGQRVVKGQIIGYMGSTGNSTGSHLHFEIRGAKNPF